MSVMENIKQLYDRIMDAYELATGQNVATYEEVREEFLLFFRKQFPALPEIELQRKVEESLKEKIRWMERFVNREAKKRYISG